MEKTPIEPDDMEQNDKLKQRRTNELNRIKSRKIKTCYKIKNVPEIGRISSKDSIENKEKRDNLNLVKEKILSCTDKLSLVNVVGSAKVQKPEIEPEDMKQQDKLKRRRKNELKRLKRRHIQTCYKVKNVPVIGRISSKESKQ